MSKLIKLTASALYVPDDERLMFAYRFNCNPDELGVVLLTVSDAAYIAVKTVLTTDREYSLVYDNWPSWWEDNCEIQGGLVRARHNMSERFDVLRATLSRVSGEPCINLLTYNGSALWWLAYRLKNVPLIYDVPGIRFKVTQ